MSDQVSEAAIKAVILSALEELSPEQINELIKAPYQEMKKKPVLQAA